MWLVGSSKSQAKRFDVYLGTHAWAVCQEDQVVIAQDHFVAGQALTTFEAWLRQAPARSRLSVYLSGALCRPFMTTAIPTLSTEESARALQSLAGRKTGLPGPFEVWRSSTIGSSPVLAAAIETATLELIRNAVTGAGKKHRLVSLRPLWALWLELACEGNNTPASAALVDCDSLTVLVGADDAVENVVTLAPMDNANVAREALTRMQLSADLDLAQTACAQLAIRPSPTAPMRKGLSILLEPMQ